MTSEAAIAAVDDVIDEARADLEALVRIPSISADPDHYADVRASADATVELLAGTASRTCARRGRGIAAVRDRRVDARWTRRPDCPLVRASRRAASGHRRELEERSRSSPRSATVASTVGARPTTRRARSPTPTRSARG